MCICYLKCQGYEVTKFVGFRDVDLLLFNVALEGKNFAEADFETDFAKAPSLLMLDVELFSGKIWKEIQYTEIEHPPSQPHHRLPPRSHHGSGEKKLLQPSIIVLKAHCQLWELSLGFVLIRRSKSNWYNQISLITK